jgi:hypothetical protein
MLYLLMGFRRFSHLYTNVEAALKANDLTAARRALTAWRGVPTGELSSGEIAKLAIERGLVDSYRQCSRRSSGSRSSRVRQVPCCIARRALLAEEWKADARGADTTPIAQSRAVLGAPARGLLWLLDWVPARLTALSFAIVGDFEDAIYCWRTQAKTWAAEAGGEHAGIVLASGAGALGVLLGGPVPVVGRGAGGAARPRPQRSSRSGSAAERGRPHLARARAVARADGAADACELGTVIGSETAFAVSRVRDDFSSSGARDREQTEKSSLTRLCESRL